MSETSLQPAETDHLEALMTRTAAVLDGHFLLSSGLHSDRYIQCARLLQHPVLAGQVGKQLAAELQKCTAPNAAAPVDARIGYSRRSSPRKNSRMRNDLPLPAPPVTKTLEYWPGFNSLVSAVYAWL